MSTGVSVRSDEPPGRARTRWDVADGGEVGYLDLGDALLLVPGGVEAFRRRVLGAVTEAVWAAAASGFGDPDLADESSSRSSTTRRSALCSAASGQACCRGRSKGFRKRTGAERSTPWSSSPPRSSSSACSTSGRPYGRLRERNLLNPLAGEALAAANHLGADVVLSAPSPRLESRPSPARSALGLGSRDGRMRPAPDRCVPLRAAP